jgi:hypothetical protein
MDPAMLAAAVTSFLAPYLAKAGTAVLDRATAALPDAAANLWNTITHHFESKPAAAAVTTELVQQPSDEDKQAAFNLQLKMALKSDPDFAAAVEGLIKQAAPEQQGGHNVTIGNVSGSSVVFGNNNTSNFKSGS